MITGSRGAVRDTMGFFNRWVDVVEIVTKLPARTAFFSFFFFSSAGRREANRGTLFSRSHVHVPLDFALFALARSVLLWDWLESLERIPDPPSFVLLVQRATGDGRDLFFFLSFSLSWVTWLELCLAEIKRGARSS